jgi:hypothetical protein
VVAISLVPLANGGSVILPIALIGLLVGGTGLWLVGQGARQLVSRLGFREAVISTEQEAWMLGATARFSLRLIPRRPCRIQGGTARLITVVIARKADQGKSKTSSATLYERTEPLALPVGETAGLEHAFELEIPRALPPTWEGKYNRFITTVEVNVQIDQWPDLTVSQPVVVAPEMVPPEGVAAPGSVAPARLAAEEG